MIESDDDLVAVWRGTSADVRSDRSACLTEVEWRRLLTKEADDGERARAADHIGSCSECAEEYRLLQPLALWAAEVEQVSIEQLALGHSLDALARTVGVAPFVAGCSGRRGLVGLAAPLYVLVEI